MHRNTVRNCFLVLFILSFSFVLGCAGIERTPEGTYLPKALPDADRAVEKARKAGKGTECPDKFYEVASRRDDAYAVYRQCRTHEAIRIAKDAQQMADTLCPAKPAKITPPPPPPAMPAPPPPAKVIEKMSLHLHFYVDKAAIKEKDHTQLNEAIAFIKKYPNANVVVEGHTDNIGPSAYNHTLSHRRADAVKNYFVTEGGIEESKIKAIGYGESRPLYTNDTPWGRYWNRRVDILIVREF